MDKRWTEDEEDYLLSFMRDPDGDNWQDVADFLGRAVTQCYAHSFRLRKKHNIEAPFKKRFTQDDIEYIRTCYEKGVPVKQMADHLNRPSWSIRDQIQKRGINKKN